MASSSVQHHPKHLHSHTEYDDGDRGPSSVRNGPIGRSRSNSVTNVDSDTSISSPVSPLPPLRGSRTALQWPEPSPALRGAFVIPPQSPTITHYATLAAGALIGVEGAAAVTAVLYGVQLPWISAGVYLGVGIGFCVAGLLIVGAALWQRSRSESQTVPRAAPPPVPTELLGRAWTTNRLSEDTSPELTAKLAELPDDLRSVFHEAFFERYKNMWSTFPPPTHYGRDGWMPQSQLVDLLDNLLEHQGTLLLGVDATTLRICMHGAQNAEQCVDALNLFATGRYAPDDFAAVMQTILAPCPRFIERSYALNLLAAAPVDALTVLCAGLAHRLYATRTPPEVIPTLITHVLSVARAHSYTSDQVTQLLRSAIDVCQMNYSASWYVVPFLAHVADELARANMVKSLKETLHQLNAEQVAALFRQDAQDAPINDTIGYFAAIARFCTAAREQVDDLSTVFDTEVPAMVARCAPERRQALITALIDTYAADDWNACYLGSQASPSGRWSCLVDRLDDMDAIVKLNINLRRLYFTERDMWANYYHCLAETSTERIRDVLHACQMHPDRRPQKFSWFSLLRMERGALEKAFAEGRPVSPQPHAQPIYLKQARRNLLTRLTEGYPA